MKPIRSFPARRALLVLGVLGAAQLHAATLIPMQGQTPEQIQADTSACQAQSAQAASAPPAQPAPTPQGGRVRGAAAGAVAGAAAAEVRGNQYEAYDKVDSDVQQEYRQNEAQQAAAAGAVVGASRQRQQRRQAQQQQQSAAQPPPSSDAFNACMSGRGYSVTP